MKKYNRSSYHVFKLFLKHFEFADDRECWEWQGALDPDGYGRFSWPERHIQKAAQASYEFFIGDRQGMYVLHDCDNPACMNPAHLWLGTHQQNMDDMWKKERGSHVGSRGNNAGVPKPHLVLTDHLVRKIRRLYGKGRYSYTKLARKVGIGVNTVVRIVKYEIYADGDAR